MLDALRSRATGWVAQLFIALLVLSFAVWGVSDVFTGFRSDTVASVGRTNISTTNFARQYDQALQSMTRQMGQAITPEQAQLFGVPGQVLGRLVTQATLDDTARQFGLGLSNEVLAKEIAEDPAFRGPAGGFDRLFFTQVLRNNSLSEDQYVRDRHAVLLRYQVSDALVGATVAPDPYLRALHEYRSEERSIDYLQLTAAAAGVIGEPGDADLSAFFEENKAQWRAPEYRALSYFKVVPADIAKPGDVTDEEARADYDKNIKDYTKLEQRKVSQIHFDVREEADAATTAIAGGKAFDEVATERKLSAADTSLGFVTRDQIIDPKVSEAAFSLTAGSVSGVVESDFGFFIVRVEEVQPEIVKTFEEVKDEIKNRLAVERATKRIIGTYDQVEDARAAGETLAEIAPKIGVQLAKVDAIDRSGNDDKGNKVADLPGSAELLKATFETDVGIENDAVRTEGNGYVWFEVTAVTAERDRQLDEVRDKVVAAWKEGEIEKRLTAKAEEIRARLAGSETIDKVAEELSLELKSASKLTRTTQPPADLSPAVLAEAFGGPTGYAAVANGASAGTKIVLVVKDATVPAFDAAAAELAQTRKQISDQIANDYLQQFLVEMQAQAGLSVNQTAMQAVIGQQRPGL
jgi:peptidyl-prolyl cis-trans isomerase D